MLVSLGEYKLLLMSVNELVSCSECWEVLLSASVLVLLATHPKSMSGLLHAVFLGRGGAYENNDIPSVAENIIVKVPQKILIYMFSAALAYNGILFFYI